MQAQTQHQAQAVAEIRAALFAMQDENYRDFHAKLIPNVDKETIIGVRVPRMRAYARSLWKQAPETVRAFLEVLPHKYYEENCLHGLLIGVLSETADEALRLIDRFLPYVDNWATCDMLPPKIFASDLARVRETVLPWLASEETYRVRFAIVTLLTFFLEEETFAECFEDDISAITKRIAHGIDKLCVVECTDFTAGSFTSGVSPQAVTSRPTPRSGAT